MANKKKYGERELIGAYVPVELKKRFVFHCDERCMTQNVVLTKMIEKKVKEWDEEEKGEE